MGTQKCIRHLRERGAKTLFFLGDAVGYLPMEAGVLAQFRAADVICVKGNHDAMLVGDLPLDPGRDATYQLEAARTRLQADDLTEIRSWPERIVLRSPETRASILLAHGGPNDPLNEYIYPDSDLRGIEATGYRAVMIGQTHRPFVRSVGPTLLVNVGSCGLPRDIGNLAACALYDPTTNSAQILRVAFDAEELIAAAERVAPVAESVKTCLRRTDGIGCADGD